MNFFFVKNQEFQFYILLHFTTRNKQKLTICQTTVTGRADMRNMPTFFGKWRQLESNSEVFLQKTSLFPENLVILRHNNRKPWQY